MAVPMTLGFSVLLHPVAKNRPFVFLAITSETAAPIPCPKHLRACGSSSVSIIVRVQALMYSLMLMSLRAAARSIAALSDGVTLTCKFSDRGCLGIQHHPLSELLVADDTWNHLQLSRGKGKGRVRPRSFVYGQMWRPFFRATPAASMPAIVPAYTFAYTCTRRYEHAGMYAALCC